MTRAALVPARNRKPRGEGATRKPEILAAAKRLFVEEGFERVTMRRIASEVGVSATALYVYFPDKDAILQAVAREHFSALLAALEVAVQPGRPAPENLRRGVRAYAEFALSRPDEYRLTFMRDGRSTSEDPCENVAEADISFEVLLRGVQAMVDEGYFPPRPAMLMAEAIWAATHGVVSLLLTLPDEVQSDPATLIDLVIDSVIRGLCVEGAKLSIVN